MPIFEYKCSDCGSKFDILHKSINNREEVICPSCKSKNNKKLMSAFSASVHTDSYTSSNSSCESGTCEAPSFSGPECASGLCGLN
jgi:putative FmdB family regulatory protein